VELVKLAIVIAAVIGIAKGVQLFSSHCRRRFGYSFFSARGFWLAALSINFLWWGFIAWGSAFLHHTPQSGALALMGIGLAAAAWLVHGNIQNTDLPYGVAGSTLQLTLFFPLAIYGIPMLLITLLFLMLATIRGGPAAWFAKP
jgi:hypothetical protein